MNLSAIDLTILLVYLVGMVGLGLYLGRHHTTTSDFMLGGRTCPWWVILCSIVATETSTITFLAIPGIGWQSDLTFLQLPLGYILGRLIVVVLFGGCGRPVLLPRLPMRALLVASCMRPIVVPPILIVCSFHSQIVAT